MAKATESLIKIGYDYIALGGMVPQPADSIHMALSKITSKFKKNTKLHLLGFGKIERIREFYKYNLYSIDTTSPLLRAFKDKKMNLFMPGDKKNILNYYTALRIPQSTENRNLMKLIKQNYVSYDEVHQKENKVLNSLRKYDSGKLALKETLSDLMDYTKIVYIDPNYPEKNNSEKLDNLNEEYKHTLENMPWKQCKCNVCQKCGIEMAIFRGSNRNKRRGIHNLFVFHNALSKISKKYYEKIN